MKVAPKLTQNPYEDVFKILAEEIKIREGEIKICEGVLTTKRKRSFFSPQFIGKRSFLELFFIRKRTSY